MGTTRYQVTQVNRTTSGVALLTLQDGSSNIDIQQTYLATFEAQDWSMEGEFRLYEHLENSEKGIIIGIFQRR
jgi:hypothetical protein